MELILIIIVFNKNGDGKLFKLMIIIKKMFDKGMIIKYIKKF